MSLLGLPTLRAFSRLALWSSIVFNVAIIAWDAAIGHYRSGVVGLWNVVVLSTWLLLLTKVDSWTDALHDDAVARQRMTELALQAMRAQMDAGNVSVNITSEQRMH